jgi:riboflavin synthase
MFTGIIQDMGVIKRLQRKGNNTEFTLLSDKLTHDIKIGDSVAISGVCLTTTAVDSKAHHFVATAVSETLRRTTLGDLSLGDQVNLELALQPTGRLGGHFVQGHIDTIGRCSAVPQGSGSREIRFDFPQEYGNYVVEKGSIAIDGVSLTVYDVKSTQFTASIIPHTWESTTLSLLKAGTRVNYEFDLLAKYIAKMTGVRSTGTITLDRLREYGY